MIDFCLLLLLTASQIAVCFQTAVLPGEYPLANLMILIFIFWESELLLATSVRLIWFWCVRLFTTKNGDRLLVCIVCLMDERSLSGFGALYPVLRRRFFSRIRGMEDITTGGLFLTSLALVNWIFVLCSILL